MIAPICTQGAGGPLAAGWSQAGEIFMKIKVLLTASVAAVGLAGFGNAALADAAAGKKTFDEICSECHEAADFEGEDAAEVTATVKKIVAGQMKHKKALKLTDEQAADVAAYMASGGK
jgi:mono/diheme cytochrome c family protein